FCDLNFVTHHQPSSDNSRPDRIVNSEENPSDIPKLRQPWSRASAAQNFDYLPVAVSRSQL
ncbi:MAG: hypothetical protein VYA50_09185, partial [Chloroflexota bacterium]|nr:hypothetical protein [Chloroflexota bacterium]